MKVALLTGGSDPHYAQGLARELAARGVDVAVVGSEKEMVAFEEGRAGRVVLYDLVGKSDPSAGWIAKATRLAKYYVALLVFAARTEARLFHILWFRRFPRAERILVTSYLKLIGKKLVFTAHNVDQRVRDGKGSRPVDMLSLKFLYRIVDHLFVHTTSMRLELMREFAIPMTRVTVVPLGINDVIPIATATQFAARQKLGLDVSARVLLFFGQIKPYKGLEVLIRALAELARDDDRCLLVIAGRVHAEPYWRDLQKLIVDLRLSNHVRTELGYIPDATVGLFFKAADASVLPYYRIYQSGVLGLSYAQGLPVIAADVGAMKEDIVEGETGLLFRAGDAADLTAKIRAYFASELFKDREARAQRLSDHGAERFSWKTNADRTYSVYERLLR